MSKAGSGEEKEACPVEGLGCLGKADSGEDREACIAQGQRCLGKVGSGEDGIGWGIKMTKSNLCEKVKVRLKLLCC